MNAPSGKAFGRAVSLLVLAGMVTTPVASKERRLDGQQIRVAISGRSVTDARHWEHRYHADGRLGRTESGRERAGQWSVKGDQLCLLLTEVSKREPVCFHVTRDRDALQYQDDQSTVYRGWIRPMPQEKP